MLAEKKSQHALEKICMQLVKKEELKECVISKAEMNTPKRDYKETSTSCALNSRVHFT